MATILNSNLYPPIIDTYMPAFLKDAGCKVYFQLSNFNTITDIFSGEGAAQVTVSNQKTNQSELSDNYLNGIMLKEIYKDDKGFYVWIENSDIKKGFQINTYYKVQIRFTSEKVPNPPADTAIWFNENLSYFSEWSTVSLIRAISTPSLELSSVVNNELTAPNVIGKITFKDITETEGIELYRVLVLSKEKELLEDSQYIYSSNNQGNRELNYTFKTSSSLLQDGRVKIYIATRNGYIFEKEYSLNLTSSETQTPSSLIQKFDLDEENGLVQITINLINNQQKKKVIVKRASSKNSFNFWEDTYIYSLSENISSAEMIWTDYTIESGVWYKYAIQEQFADNSKTIIQVYNEEPIMMIFENMFLDAGGRQLKIKYNPFVNSYKRNISETKMDTIGSQYPFIRRNGDMNYRQLTIAGMITSLSDEDNIQFIHNNCEEKAAAAILSQGRYFTSPTELYGGEEQKELYQNYNIAHQISKYNDFIYEREFREKVIDFLYKNDVKLFRSTPEGNVLVKIMNVNLTPEVTLGRYVYSFSCEAYEIGEASLENYHQYKIKESEVTLE